MALHRISTRSSSIGILGRQNSDGSYNGYLEVKDPNTQKIVQLDPNSLVVSGDFTVHSNGTTTVPVTGLTLSGDDYNLSITVTTPTDPATGELQTAPLHGRSADPSHGLRGCAGAIRCLGRLGTAAGRARSAALPEYNVRPRNGRQQNGLRQDRRCPQLTQPSSWGLGRIRCPDSLGQPRVPASHALNADVPAGRPGRPRVPFPVTGVASGESPMRREWRVRVARPAPARCSTSSGGSCTSKSTPSIATRSASQPRSSSPVRYSQVCASIGSIVPQWCGTRPAISSAAACSVTRASKRCGAPVMLSLDEGGRVLGRQLARREAHAGRGRPRQPVDAEGAPVLAAAVPGDEVPAAAEVHERVRLDLAAAVGAVAASVGEAQALGVAAGGGDHGQVLRVDRRAADRRADRRRAERADAAAQVRGQDLLELDERAHRGLLDAGHRRARGGAQADGDRDRLLVVEQQRRHRGAGAQPVAAGRAGERLHRVAERRAAARRRGGSSGRTPRAGRRARRRASRGAPGAARAAPAAGSRSPSCRFHALRN